MTAAAAARDAALNLLSVRARRVSEMEDRLRRKDFAPDVVAETVEWLLERSLLDDEEFARLFLEDRIRRRPRGSFALVRELVKRGVARATAEEVMEKVFADEGVKEIDLARDSARTWIRKQPRRVAALLQEGRPTDDDGRQERIRQRRRLYGHLVRKGYPREIVGLVVDEVTG